VIFITLSVKSNKWHKNNIYYLILNSVR
jgi:hypothetical protein